MSNYTFRPAAPEVAVAKLQLRITKLVVRLVRLVSAALIIGGAAGIIIRTAHAAIAIGLGLIGLSLGDWLDRGVRQRQPTPFANLTRLELLLPPVVVAGYRDGITATDFWQLLMNDWQVRFMCLRFGIAPKDVEIILAGQSISIDTLVKRAAELAGSAGKTTLSGDTLAVALITSAPAGQTLMTALNLDGAELAESIGWSGRLQARIEAKRPIYGGIARDWAAGYTPTLSGYGQNLSKQIEASGGSFSLRERTDQLDNLIGVLGSSTGSVVVVGETGIGKTALLYGLAERLLRGEGASSLAHHQVVSLSAATLLSRVQGAGDIERIVLTILGEAVQASNIVIALDEAQLFFGQGVGAVNLSQLLLPVLSARRLKLILTLSPGEWQRLRSTNVALSGLLTPIVLSETSSIETRRVAADRVLGMERDGAIVTWQAIRQADVMSARYDTDEANPGRTLKLLESSLNFADGEFITSASVDRAIESQYGVKAGPAGATEAAELLGLEDKIHQRMINQTRAVSVVAAALRRSRAGVASPKRPIGSFLFLGPTGVGKTELARSLAAVYYGSETSMIRLDMSEYQQPTDAARLLASGADNTQGLLPRIKQQPFSVVLFDEIEKANPAILNLLLQLLDEGNLTDAQNRSNSFKDAIIIATSNAGADDIRQRIQAGQQLESFEQEFTDKLISSGSFKPELLNRFDEIVLFRPLSPAELAQVVGLMIAEVNQTLTPQKVTVELTPAATEQLVARGYDPRLGARPMRRMVQRTVEDAVAGKILRGTAPAGSTIHLDVADLNLPAAPPVAPPPPAS